METRTLGSSDLTVSVVGFGCWAIGGTDWGPVDDRDSVQAIHAALDAGVTLFDTADFYGFGHAEEVLAEALAGRKDKVVVATKGGLRWDAGGANVRRDGSPAHLTAAVEASLRRLKTDCIDLYQVHWPDEAVPVAESVGQLQRLREAGKLRHVGVSNFDAAQLAAALGTGPVVSLQMPLSLLDRRAEAAQLPFCQTHGLGVLAYSPLAMGLLTGKYVAEEVFSESDVRGWFPMFRGETFRAHLRTIEQLGPIASGEGKSLGQLAARWVIEHAGVTAALIGARSAEQVAQNVGAAGWMLSAKGKERIHQVLAAAETRLSGGTP